MSATLGRDIDTAWNLFRGGDGAGAERCCQKVLTVNPTHGGALGLLGLLRLTAGRVDEAAALLTQATKSKPRDAMLLGALGLAKLMGGDAAGAEEALRGALKWGPRDDAMLHMRLGMALGGQGKSVEAIAELRRALQLAPDSPEALLNLANALAESGAVAEAEVLLKRLLAHVPAHGDARHNLGTLYTRLNRLDEAAAEFCTLLKQYPDSAEAQNSLGIVLERQTKLDDAAQAYRQALKREANHVPALNNLGNVLRAQGRMDEAADCYAKAIRIAPAHADGYLNMGMLRAAGGQMEAARGLFQQALSADPQCVEAAINLGEICRQAGALHDAADAYRNALRFRPGNEQLLNGLGVVLRMRGELGEASKCFMQAMRAAPRDPSGFLNLGMLRAQQGQYEGACTLLQQAVQVDSTCKWAWLKLAEALRVTGRLEEAGDAYRQLLLLDPGNAAAAAGLAHVQQHQCDWNGIETLWDEARLALGQGKDVVITPFSALSIPTTPQEQLTCARTWAAQEFGWIARNDSSGANRRIIPAGTNPAVSKKSSRIRVGYLSWDYHEHATAYLMAEIFELHDRDRFDIVAYSFGPDDGSAIRQRIRGACDAFIDIADMSDTHAADLIAGDGIDILIDLKGYTLGARTAILAYRPAPVQANWLGFPGTMGSSCIDWIIADPFIIPMGSERFYDENVYRMPDCYQPNDRRREVAEAPTRAECGLPDEGVVFCCFNQPYKILPQTFASWMHILCRVPGSLLWLLETSSLAKQNLRMRASEHGVHPDRIVFAPHKPLAAHLARYRIADLALDTFPYTSHTTASDALWAGCPLVARVGDTFASRVSGSILNAAHLPELIAYTADDFEDLAVRVATSPEWRALLRERLRSERGSVPLFDTPRFVANLECAFQQMHEGRR